MPKELLKQIGEEIRKMRGKESQDDFAVRIGISRKTLSIIENGSRSYRIDELLKIIQATGKGQRWLASILDSDDPNIKFHKMLAEIFKHAPEDEQQWIKGNIQTFHRAYVRRSTS